MKRIVSVVLTLLLLIALTCPASASELPLVIDNGNLLTAAEEETLTQSALQLQDAYDMDVVILTLDGLGEKSPQDYADDYYDTQGYRDDGLLFLLSMEERDWYISTKGEAIYALTDYGIQQLGESVLPYLSAGDYAGGFETFLKALPAYLDAYQAGHPIDGYADQSGDFYHGDQEEVVYYQPPQHLGLIHILISLAIGLLFGGVTIVVLRASMNTKRPQRSAGSYLTHYYLGRCQDLFLYSHVDRIKKPEPPQNTGGGSSVHTSSSGSRHRGGGGKF